MAERKKKASPEPEKSKDAKKEKDKKQKEVTDILGISKVKVSRLEKKLLRQMRNNIDKKSN